MHYALIDCDGREFGLFGVHGLTAAERAASGKPATEALLNTGRATAFEAKRIREELANEDNRALESLRNAIRLARGGVCLTGGELI